MRTIWALSPTEKTWVDRVFAVAEREFIRVTPAMIGIMRDYARGYVVEICDPVTMALYEKAQKPLEQTVLEVVPLTLDSI